MRWRSQNPTTGGLSMGGIPSCMDPWTNGRRCHAMQLHTHISVRQPAEVQSRRNTWSCWYTRLLLSSWSKAEPHGKAERAANKVQSVQDVLER
jgi:hypothetical protein